MAVNRSLPGTKETLHLKKQHPTNVRCCSMRFIQTLQDAVNNSSQWRLTTLVGRDDRLQAT